MPPYPASVACCLARDVNWPTPRQVATRALREPPADHAAISNNQR